MSEDTHPTNITILDKEYLIACTGEEEIALQASARYLDRKMREIRDRGNVVGADRIAVMAALNMAHDLLESKTDNDTLNHSMGDRIRSIQDKIEQALNRGKQLEF